MSDMKRVAALALIMLIALALAASAETDDELLIQQIDDYFTMTRNEIIEQLGPGYEEVAAGPEGVCDGYYYEELGMVFAFYPDSDSLEMIDCYPEFKIRGVGVGSQFTEIMAALGETEIVETWLELPIYTAYMVRYRFGNSDFSFISFEKDEPVHMLFINETFEMYGEEDLS
jgi:hypothetical protein